MRMSAADVAIERERVSSALRVAGVRVRAKPDDYAKYGLDEGQLETTLQEYVHYRNDGARRFDVDSISAVHRLREGRSPNKLEQCRYVLASGNSEIVRAAQRIQGEHHEWPLVMTETALAALLWVRSPTGIDDLPRTLLLATAYAGMQPDPRLWVKYIEEVANLEKRGHLNPEDAMILRSTAVARSALMEETLGDDQEITSDAPLVVLKRIKDELSKPLVDEVASITELERLAREKADREVENNVDLASQVEALVARLGSAALHIEVTDKARDAKIRASAERRAIISVRAYAAVIAIALAMFSSLSIWYQPWAGTIPAWVKIASGGSAVVLVIVATVRAFLPGTITDWFARPLHTKLADRYERRVRESAQLTQGPAPEL